MKNITFRFTLECTVWILAVKNPQQVSQRLVPKEEGVILIAPKL